MWDFSGSKTVARVALVFACFLWALSFIASKTALESTPPLAVVTMRLSVSALCFIAWAFYARIKIWSIIHKGGYRLFILSLSGTVLHYAAQTIGLKYTTASNGSLYAVTAPLSIVIISRIFFKEKITAQKTAGIITALLGVMIVTGAGSLLKDFEIKSITGDSLVFLSIVMWGFFTVFGRDYAEKTGGAMTMTAAVTITGALAMLPLGAAEMYYMDFSFSDVSAISWRSILFLGITCSFAATLLYFKALERMNPNEAGVYLYAIPPMTCITAFFYSGEQLAPSFIIGSALVLIGVFITEKV